MKNKVYEIQNSIDEKIYVGVTIGTLEARLEQHSKAESYLGRAIRKHGIENFSIKSLHQFESKEEMFAKEAEIVNEVFLKRTDVYNLKLGGLGGFDYINKNCGNQGERLNNVLTTEQRVKGGKTAGNLRKQRCETDLEFAQNLNKNFKDGFKNKNHNEETKRKIGEANSQHQKGSGNSQFGSMWIHNLEEKLSKKIQKEEFLKFETEGWLKGRKMKF